MTYDLTMRTYADTICLCARWVSEECCDSPPHGPAEPIEAICYALEVGRRQAPAHLNNLAPVLLVLIVGTSLGRINDLDGQWPVPGDESAR